MPLVNLAVAQAAAACVAAPTLVALFVDFGPAYYYVVAAVGALIVLAGAWIGSAITSRIGRPTVLSLIAAVAFAILAAAAAMLFVAPAAANSELMALVFTLAPVAGAMAGYFLTVPRPA